MSLSRQCPGTRRWIGVTLFRAFHESLRQQRPADFNRSVGYLAGMQSLLDSFRRNAEAAQAEAASSLLPNVRDRAARAAAVWETMIERHEAMEERQRAKCQDHLPGQ